MLCALIFGGAVMAQNAGPRILVMGDSLLATHNSTGFSVADNLERLLGEKVRDQSVSGAHMIYRLPISGAAGLSIPKQFREGNWQWVVLTGGGNDLWLGCGCNRCERKMNRLISSDGRKGVIPSTILRARKSGARVIYVGYLRSPGFGSPIESCRDEGDELERRIAKLAAIDPGLYFQSNADLVPHGDKSFHAVDRIHPSRKGSLHIAQRIAQVISGR